ncbi:leucine-rich repeat-containing protein 23-like [Cimex lectularius]|uniref:Leucine-rich repeat-containing protein 23 n=1 Tax=Cimex lectularius TaxID=79782 RepID=A0A8I6R960_CIMLE|nr:leucine-rich repeat-containing protein 23-like [Cimex lectularius]
MTESSGVSSTSETDLEASANLRSASEFSVGGTAKPIKGLLKKGGSMHTFHEDSRKTPDRDKPRKGLQWNISQMTWTEELKQIREEIARRKLESPGVKSLVTIPRERFYHWQFDFEDMTYYPYGLDLSHMAVQDIQIINVLKHLAYLDLSDNEIKNGSLKILEEVNSLIALNLDQNQLTSMNFPGCGNMRWISLKNNTMTAIDRFSMPLLEYAHLDSNQIKTIENFDAENTPVLRLLSLKGNRVSNLKDNQLSPSLKYLYLGNNKIRSCEGLAHLSNLTVLHLRGNKIKKLKSIPNELKNLHYLNLRDNPISNVRQFKKLRGLSKLRILITTDCAFEKANPRVARSKVIFCLMHLKRLNKQEVMASEIQKSKKFRDEIEAEEESSEDDVLEDVEEDDEKYKVASNPSTPASSTK